ncbi:GAF domain-containing protein [bacterium]|nr:GAF domain-containing protein [bacterium]
MVKKQTDRVLLIDDEKLFREMMSDILRKENYKVTIAEEGQKGIALAKKEEFDLIILDIYMPGLSGLDTLLALKKFCPELPVIMVTAKDTPENYEESMRIGASDYLLKPVSRERLLRSIKTVTERQRHMLSEAQWLDSLTRLKRGTEKFKTQLWADKRKLVNQKIETSLETIVSLIAELLQVNIVAIMLIDHSVQKLVIKASFGITERIVKRYSRPIAEGISGHVVHTGEPLLIQDVRKSERFKPADYDFPYEASSLLSVPIIAGGRVEGVINVNDKKDNTLFDERDLTLLEMFAQNIEFMLDNLELYHQLEERLNELTLLYQINHRIGQTLDFNTLVDEVMSTIHEAFDVEATVLLLVKEDKEPLYYRFGIINDQHIMVKLDIDHGDGLPGWSVQNNKSVISNDVKSDARHSLTLDQTLEIKTRNMVCVPLILAGNILGVTILINKKNDLAFTEREKNLLEMISAETVLVLKNAWLHSSLQQKIEEALATQKRETHLKQILKNKMQEIDRLKEGAVITFKIEDDLELDE